MADTLGNRWWLRAADIRAEEVAQEPAEEWDMRRVAEAAVRIAAAEVGADPTAEAEVGVVRMVAVEVAEVVAVRTEEAGAVVAGGAGADNFSRE